MCSLGEFIQLGDFQYYLYYVSPELLSPIAVVPYILDMFINGYLQDIFTWISNYPQIYYGKTELSISNSRCFPLIALLIYHLVVDGSTCEKSRMLVLFFLTLFYIKSEKQI